MELRRARPELGITRIDINFQSRTRDSNASADDQFGPIVVGALPIRINHTLRWRAPSARLAGG